MAYVKYKHHNATVSVREDLKGKHRAHCLCYDCKFFHPEDRELNCPIANKVFQLCVDENIVLPVWECPVFVEA